MKGERDIWAVLPVKNFTQAKQRLSSTYPPSIRQALARTMLIDVLRALKEVPSIAGIVVVTADKEAARLARNHGAEAFDEPTSGDLNDALIDAANRLAEAGRGSMLVVPADIPGITADEIETLIASHPGRRGLTVVPDRRREGTNALLMTPPGAITPSFGSGSFRRHLRAGREAALAPRELALARFGLDIDHPEDLAVFAKTPSPTATWRYLQSLGLRESSPDRLPEGLGGILEDAVAGHRPDDAASLALADCVDLPALMAASAAIRDAGFGNLVTYSRKVFVPLTHLCRDSCHYCTFAHPPRAGDAAFLDPDAVLEIAESGRRAGCKEVLFTLGDKPEWRYRVAREALARLGHATTLDYLGAIAGRVLAETGLLPHLNPGVMSLAEIRRLRPVAGSMGLMLESASARLSEPGGPHYGSPDKHPAARLASIAAAGEAAVPFTSGLLIGIGETRRERIESLLALRALNDRYGHLQEVIIQNFCAKPDTRMKQAPEPSFEDHLWTVAVARIILGPAISVQAPPNLSAGSLEQLIQAGINDWGGISPVTPDHVNPEAPWPQIDRLAQVTAGAGKLLTERLTLYPRHIADAERWVDPQVKPAVLRLSDAAGLGRPNGWAPGSSMTLPPLEPRHPMRRPGGQGRDRLERFLEQAAAGEELAESEIVALFEARGEDFWRVCSAADALRRQVNGDSVSYIVNRNITYTNVCSFKCQFCAFSKGKMSENLRGRPYDYDLPEIARRTREAWDRGATEVCIQGGIHPSYTGRRYLEILDAVKTAVPDIHVHAFSPLEISQGAATLGLTVRDFLCDLRRAGLGTLPGTAAEILDDEVRRIICPDKLDSAAWLSVVETAHDLGLRTTATILFGHVEQPLHWARHLLLLRRLQARSGGFTEFVPLPFVAAETPIYLKGRSRFGPTLREAVLMHAVARLVLHPLIPNIQSSWVKMGIDGVLLCLKAGANDFGGTLMNENISRSAGAAHGQELSPDRMVAAIQSLGRRPRQRTTLYENAPEVEPAIYS